MGYILAYSICRPTCKANLANHHSLINTNTTLLAVCTPGNVNVGCKSRPCINNLCLLIRPIECFTAYIPVMFFYHSVVQA